MLDSYELVRKLEKYVGNDGSVLWIFWSYISDHTQTYFGIKADFACFVCLMLQGSVLGIMTFVCIFFCLVLSLCTIILPSHLVFSSAWCYPYAP